MCVVCKKKGRQICLFIILAHYYALDDTIQIPYPPHPSFPNNNQFILHAFWGGRVGGQMVCSLIEISNPLPYRSLIVIPEYARMTWAKLVSSKACVMSPMIFPDWFTLSLISVVQQHRLFGQAHFQTNQGRNILLSSYTSLQLYFISNKEWGPCCLAGRNNTGSCVG